MARKRNKRRKTNYLVIGIVSAIFITFFACGLFMASRGKDKEEAQVLYVNNDVVTSNAQAVEEGSPCGHHSDCGLDGCIQEGNVCNGRRYRCVLGKCEIEDNLFHDSYCTPFGCQETCGNSACETQYGENVENCPMDCLGKFD